MSSGHHGLNTVTPASFGTSAIFGTRRDFRFPKCASVSKSGRDGLVVPSLRTPSNCLVAPVFERRALPPFCCSHPGQTCVTLTGRSSASTDRSTFSSGSRFPTLQLAEAFLAPSSGRTTSSSSFAATSTSGSACGPRSRPSRRLPWFSERKWPRRGALPWRCARVPLGPTKFGSSQPCAAPVEARYLIAEQSVAADRPLGRPAARAPPEVAAERKRSAASQRTDASWAGQPGAAEHWRPVLSVAPLIG